MWWCVICCAVLFCFMLHSCMTIEFIVFVLFCCVLCYVVLFALFRCITLMFMFRYAVLYNINTPFSCIMYRVILCYFVCDWLCVLCVEVWCVALLFCCYGGIFCFVVYCFVLIWFVLCFYCILSCLVCYYNVLFHVRSFCFVLFCFVLFCHVLVYFVVFSFELFYYVSFICITHMLCNVYAIIIMLC